MDCRNTLGWFILDIFLFAVLIGYTQQNDKERKESMATQMSSLCESYAKQIEKHGDALDNSFVCLHSKDLSATFSKAKDGKFEILIDSDGKFFKGFRVRGRDLNDLRLLAVEIIMDGGGKSNNPSINGSWIYETWD